MRLPPRLGTVGKPRVRTDPPVPGGGNGSSPQDGCWWDSAVAPVGIKQSWREIPLSRTALRCRRCEAATSSVRRRFLGDLVRKQDHVYLFSW